MKVTAFNPHHRVAASSVLPPFLLPTTFLLFAAFGLGDNTLLAILAIAVLILGSALLWRPGEPPVMLFAFVYQWLQASIAIFYANAAGFSFAEFPYIRTQSLAEATVLSLIGLVAMALGLRLGAGASQRRLAEEATAVVSRVPFERWMKVYAGFWLFSTFAQTVAYVVPGLSQIMLAVGNLKWAGYLIFTIAAFGGAGVRLGFWFLAFALEFLLSFKGFFSGFKEVFFYTFIAASTARVRLSASRAIGGAFLVVVLLALGVVWTAIKPEYRSFLNGGAQSQTVVVGLGDSFAELARLTSNLDSNTLAEGARKLILRISYVEFFGGVLDTVPSAIPHEGGKLWLDAVSRPFMPRLLFPEKAILDDSALTKKYSSIEVAGADRGTSISIGYVGETYIDFGEYGMMLVLFAFWFAIGRFYHFMITNRTTNPLAGMALVCPVIMSADRLEIALAKMVGAVAVYALVAWIAIKFVIPRFVKVLAR